VGGGGTVEGTDETHRPRMGQRVGGADLMVGDLTTFVSTVRDEAFYVEVNLSDEDPSGSLDLGFESPPLEIA
jgi:hypothetical protein